jgi:selenocysteine lyase/cysteine desulfurase
MSMVDWTAIRKEFPVTERWAYFDHAAVAPMTARAQAALADWSRDVAENGDVNESRWVERVESVRRQLADLLNADPLDVAFVKNTSEGIGIVAEGFPWAAGDNIVTAEEEYPANIYPWMNLAGRGVELRRVPSRGPRVAIDDIAAAIDAHTRVVSLSYVEFASGFRNDLEAVGTICRHSGILFVVDAIQGLGVLPLDVNKLPVDALSADGHKWLLGPEGAGVFYLRRDLIDRLHPVGIGWNSVIGSRRFSKIDFQLKPGAGRWESGSLNVGGILALGASLGVLNEIGWPVIHERVLSLTDYLCERAAARGLEVFSSRLDRERSSIVSLVASGQDSQTVKRRCRDAGIVINHRAGRLRFSPHAYNTEDELDRAIDVIQGTRT